MKLQILSAVGSAVLLTSGVALASTPVIGIASSQSGVTLDNAKVSGNATIFDGSTLQTDGYSRIHLNNGTRLDLGAGSKATVYANRLSLERGSSETQGANFEVDVNTLKIRSEAGGTARVKIDGNKMVYVTALNAPVNVLNREGLLVAKVAPGLPLSFLPQASGASAPAADTPTDSKGKKPKKGSKAAGAAGAGAGAGAGAAAAGAGAAGAAAGAAAISTTALVIGGVAVATATGLGVAAATGAIGDSSP